MSHLQDRADQKLRIFMSRIVEHLIREAGFDNSPAAHHHHPVRQHANHGQIMRHDDDGKVELGNKVAQKVAAVPEPTRQGRLSARP